MNVTATDRHTTSVIRLGRGFDADDSDEDSVPIGYIQDRNPATAATTSHRTRTVDTSDDFLTPKRATSVRSRAAWNPEETRRTRPHTSNPEVLLRQLDGREDSDTDEPLTQSLDARDGKTKEQRAKDHELRRLRRKVEQMERANGTRQSSTRRRSRSGSEVEGTESTTEHEPRRNASNRGTRTSACNARSERRLDVTQTDSTKRGSNVSDGTPAFASRSRVSRASGTPSARSSDGASSIGAAASPVVAASVVDVEEPWGPKPDGEPKGLYGKYDGEEFQMFVPRPNVSRNENLVHFMMSATPPNVLTLCKITRIKARPDTSKRKPAYSLVLQSGGVGGEEVALLETKRTSKGKHIYYEFAIGNHFLGKLKCNLSAKKFTLFDGGVKVSKSGMIPVSQRGVEFREELASVSYIKTPRGPRQLVATIPSLSRTGSGRGPLFLVNKIPQWDADLKVHTLKYHHRATEKSVKNFQLMADCSKQEQPPVLLRFGKVASDTFNLDFRGPLTPLQAMAFAMTAFEKNWLEGLQ